MFFQHLLGTLYFQTKWGKWPPAFKVLVSGISSEYYVKLVVKRRLKSTAILARLPRRPSPTAAVPHLVSLPLLCRNTTVHLRLIFFSWTLPRRANSVAAAVGRSGLSSWDMRLTKRGMTLRNVLGAASHCSASYVTQCESHNVSCVLSECALIHFESLCKSQPRWNQFLALWGWRSCERRFILREQKRQNSHQVVTLTGKCIEVGRLLHLKSHLVAHLAQCDKHQKPFYLF